MSASGGQVLSVKRFAVLCVCVCAFVSFGSGIVVGQAATPEPLVVTQPAQPEQTAEEWLADRKQVNSLVDSASRMAVTVEKQRTLVCLFPELYPEGAGSWCERRYYRTLMKAVRR